MIGPRGPAILGMIERHLPLHPEYAARIEQIGLLGGTIPYHLHRIDAGYFWIAVRIFAIVQSRLGPPHATSSRISECIAFLMLGIAFLPKPARGLGEHFVDRSSSDLARDITHLLPVGDFASRDDVDDGIDNVEDQAGALLRILHVFFIFFRP